MRTSNRRLWIGGISQDAEFSDIERAMCSFGNCKVQWRVSSGILPVQANVFRGKVCHLRR